VRDRGALKICSLSLSAAIMRWKSGKPAFAVEVMTKSWPVTAPSSQGFFRGRGRGLGYGRQATFLSWFQTCPIAGTSALILTV
jgi:hypothetical protein